MGRLGLGMRMAGRLLGAAPALPLKIVADGDSITAASGSYTDLWVAANPTVPFLDVSQSGAKISGANSLNARLSSVIAAAPSHVTVFIGANDLYLLGTTAWLNELWAYCAALKSGRPGVKIIVATVEPATAAIRPNQNAYRAVVNPLIRAAVGNQIDAILPFGDHPIIGTDAAASDTGLYPDGLHPNAAAYTYYHEVYADVLDAVVAGASGGVPSAFTFADVTNAAVSTAQTARTRVAGLGLGVSATASISGTGTFAGGIAAQGTAAAAVMNGDVLTSAMTSSATVGDALSQVLTIGGVSDTWTVTTAVAAPPPPDQFVRLVNAGTNTVETVNGAGYDYRAGFTGYHATDALRTLSSSIKIPAGQDGWFAYKLGNASDASGPIMALKTSATLAGYSTFNYALYRENALLTAYRAITAGVAPGAVDTAIAPAANDWVRLRRSGTTIIGEISKDGGVTYSPTKTWTGASTADLYLHFMPGSTTAGVVTTPKASGNVV